MLSIIQAAGWPIWPLIICSIVALALIVERFISYKSSKIIPAKLLDDAMTATRTELPSNDLIRQLENTSAYGVILGAGLQTLRSSTKPSPADVKSAMESAGKRVQQRLEKNLSALATIASAAPLLGLLGTVIGMIEIFGVQTGATGSNPAALAHGISVALYNTAFGLIVAIPSLMFWRYFRTRVDAYLTEMEVGAERFARHLKDRFDLS